METFFSQVFDLVCRNFKLMSRIGYAIIAVGALVASINAYLLPVPAWEGLLSLHLAAKLFLGLIFMPFILCAAAHMVELRPE